MLFREYTTFICRNEMSSDFQDMFMHIAGCSVIEST